MEEHVGQWWHRLINRLASTDYPASAVALEEVRHEAGILFRALGGEGGLRIEPCTESRHGARRSLAQRIAGTGSAVELAWRDEETLRLPMRISLFESRALNRDLYLWLAALASMRPVNTPTLDRWVRHNVSASDALLQRYPGLRPRYRHLVEAHLATRPAPETLSGADAALERRIRAALLQPVTGLTSTDSCAGRARRAPAPVPLWLHPSPPVTGSLPVGVRVDDGVDEEHAEEAEQAASKELESDKRRRGERVDAPDGRDGLLAFRLESLFTRAEYVAVDRSTEEDTDEDGRAALEDLDELSMASGGKRPASRLRFDLDLPSEAHDDIRLGEGIRLPEWDFKKQCLVPDQCLLQPLLARDSQPCALPNHLRQKADRMKQLFELIQPRRTWLRGQLDGSDIDIDALIDRTSDQRLGIDSGELRLYRQARQTERDLACLLLADLSLSTDTYVDNDHRVIDVIRDSLLLFSEALASTRDRFALYGFSSRRREHVRFHTLKQFDDRHDETIIGRIMQIKPGYYTRMGAALRYATQLLEPVPASRKLLILLTDGKPNDLDRYEGRYGVEDTRQAVLACAKHNVTPFCVTIDDKAREYLPYLFGQSAYLRVGTVNELPARLPAIYARLTR